MAKHPEDSNQNNLPIREESEDSNQKNLLRKMANSNKHNPKPQECVGKVKR